MKATQVLIVFLLLAGAVLAQKPEPLLMDVDSLSKHLTDRNLVVLHVGKKEGYDTGHIPGARHISMDDVSLPMSHAGKDLMLELPPPEALRTRLSALGVSDDSHIVVYNASDESFQSATRIVFTLQYLGLGDHTSVLDGGMKAWTAAGKPVNAAAPPATAGKLTAQPVKPVVADAAFVQTIAQHPNTRLVDARAPAFYKGMQPSFEKLGHIPGAVNIPFSMMLDDQSKVDLKQIGQLFQAAGIKTGDTVVTYCHVGQQATAVLFGARLLGYKVMLYDGSFQDWILNERGPLEK